MKAQKGGNYNRLNDMGNSSSTSYEGLALKLFRSQDVEAEILCLHAIP